jgi:hypothetical protein
LRRQIGEGEAVDAGEGEGRDVVERRLGRPEIRVEHEQR